jgi:hypothetical protein
MAPREPERVGPLVVTRAASLDPDSVRCANCDKKLAVLLKEEDRIEPSFDELLESGAVAWPNFGWFCSVGWERDYGEKFHLSCAQREAKQGADNPAMQRTGAAGILSFVRKLLGRGSGR